MRVARCLLGLVTGAMAACFAPDPGVGLACTSQGDCPLGQTCGPDLTCQINPADAALERQPVARYVFESDLSDSAGGHHGNSFGLLPFVAGRPGAGMAMRIPASLTAWMAIADSPAFDLAAGKIELWFKIGAGAPANEYLGLISRDASGTATGGHVGIRVGHDRALVARIQRMSDPTEQTHRCTSPVTAEVWHHAELSFGPAGLTLLLDGVAADATSWLDVDGEMQDCTAPWTGGIAGNDNPWVIGALTHASSENTGTPFNIAGDVDLDDVVIWSEP